MSMSYDDRYRGEDHDESEFWCDACEDIGWLRGPDGHIWPCSECSQDVEEGDL